MTSPVVSPKGGHRFLLDEDAASEKSINLNSSEDEFDEVDSIKSKEPDSEPWTPDTSVAPSLSSPQFNPPLTPKPFVIQTRRSSTTSSSKARPESLLFASSVADPLVLGVCLVDFDHLVGPRIEWSSSTAQSTIFHDEEINKILPFLALPDGAHAHEEDFCIFHLVYPSSGPNARTVFGIACTKQIPTDELTNAPPNATRSMVQKSVVVLTSQPLFAALRDKLGVVTKALFLQKDFGQLNILGEFEASLEAVVKGVGTESGLVFGLNVRELLGRFRHRVLIILKALILQKRIMFTGHPVERLCTYQYTLISLIPSLLLTLADCGSPPLWSNGQQWLKEGRPSELRTSDRKSMLRYIGLPLDLFGKDTFFQPYLPLQQIDMIIATPSWLCGTTNEMVWTKAPGDLRVDTENATVTFTNPALEKIVSLTAEDRRWMDDLIQTTSGSDEHEGEFKGSDDWAREKFEEYISAFLASVRYKDYIESRGGTITTGPDIGAGSTMSSLTSFNPLFLAEFKKTQAYEIWQRCTDEMLFDIVEPKHPTPEQPTIAGDIGLRLQEGMIDLKLDQQLAPAKQALGTASVEIGKAVEAGSTGFFKAVEGVRGRWTARAPSPQPPLDKDMDLKEALNESSADQSVPTSPVKSESSATASTPFSRFSLPFSRASTGSTSSTTPNPTSPPPPPPISLDGIPPDAPATPPKGHEAKASVSSWGGWISTPRFSFGRSNPTSSLASQVDPVSPTDASTPHSDGISISPSPTFGAPTSPRLGGVIGNGRGVSGDRSGNSSPRMSVVNGSPVSPTKIPIYSPTTGTASFGSAASQVTSPTAYDSHSDSLTLPLSPLPQLPPLPSSPSPPREEFSDVGLEPSSDSVATITPEISSEISSSSSSSASTIARAVSPPSLLDMPPTPLHPPSPSASAPSTAGLTPGANTEISLTPAWETKFGKGRTGTSDGELGGGGLGQDLEFSGNNNSKVSSPTSPNKVNALRERFGG